MIKIKSRYFRWLFHKLTKAIVTTVSLAGVGFLSSVLVAQIDQPSKGINWKLIPKLGSFYVIVGLVIILIIYDFFTKVEKVDYEQEINDGIIELFIKNSGLDTLANEVNDAFKNGDKAKLSNLLEMKDMFTNNLKGTQK